MKEHKRKISPTVELNKKKRIKESKEKTLNTKEKNANNDSSEKVVAKKRGPRSGFLNDMVNNRVKKIFLESNIPYEYENGTINSISNNDSNKELKKEETKNLLNNLEKKDFCKQNEEKVSDINDNEIKKSVCERNIENLSKFYIKILNYIEENKNSQDNFKKSHEITPFNELDSLEILTDIKFTDTDDVKLSEQKLIDFTSELYPNIVHLDFQLLTDFFNYAHTYSPIITPAALVLRIKKKNLSPGLLLAIYALTYLFHPKQNVKLAKFYAEKSRQYLFAHIYASDIQNVHTAYLLSNFEPGTNRSYLLSGITLRLLKILNLYEEPNQQMDQILYEERVKTIWCCLGKDALMNITCHRLEHPEWLDQPLPQAATDLSIFQYYSPERLTVVFMAAVICLNKVIQHIRKRRDNNMDKNEFKKLIEELDMVHGNLNKHISLSKKCVTTNTHPQLSCVVYHYVMYFTTKLLLFNIEISPYIYRNKLLPSKKYIQIKHKSLNKNIIEEKIDADETCNINDSNLLTPISLSSSVSDIKLNNNNNDSDNNNDDNGNIAIDKNKINDDNSDFYLLSDFKNAKKTENKQMNENLNLITMNSLSSSVSLENIVDPNINYEYHKKSVLSKLSTPSFNYILYDNDSIPDEHNENKIFLEIPTTYDQNIDYESCYNVCFETAEKATNTVNLLCNTFEEANLKYQNSYTWFFYHIGLFYMNVYANFKREDVKEKIEFYHKQIKIMNKIFPFLSTHYSKLYEKAKTEAYEAFSNDNIIFCPKGYF